MIKKIIALAAAALMAASALPIAASADEWTKTDDGYVYTYDDGSTAATGWLKVGEDTYYINKDGVRKTGWLTTKTAKYYFRKDGKMAKDCKLKIGKKTYSFDKNGKLKTKTTTETTKPAETTKPTETTAATTNKQSKTVYITKTGKRYHYDSKCGNGKYYASTLDDAVKKGLTPCEKCT